MGKLLDLIKGTSSYVLTADRLSKGDDNPDLVKGSGEGSRGGKIIGHTGSGKPIYAPKGPLGLHAHHGDHERHRFAAESASAKTKGATRSYHKGKISPSTWTSEAHKQAADAHEHAGAHKKHYSGSGSSWGHEQAGLHAKGHDYRAKEHHKKAAIAHHWEQSKNKDKTKEQRGLHAKAGADHAAEYASGGTGNDREQVGALGEKLMASSKRLHPALHEKSMDDNPDLLKGDKEGSRGGNVIGHTSSGKAIYASHAGNFKAHTKGWSSKDHDDAALRHQKQADKHHRARTASMAAAYEADNKGDHAADKKHMAAGNAHQRALDYHHDAMIAHDLHASAALRAEDTTNRYGSATKPGGRFYKPPAMPTASAAEAAHGSTYTSEHVKKSVDDNPDLVKTRQTVAVNLDYDSRIMSFYKG